MFRILLHKFFVAIETRIYIIYRKRKENFMKKFKLTALALLASVFGLAACEIPEFVQVPLDWANEKIVDPIKDLIPGAKDKEEQQDEEKEKAEVVSVKVLGLPEDIDDETAPFQLSAEVEVKGDASKDVTWSSSDTSVATVDANGKVTLTGAEGKVTISAASVADPSKVGSVEFEVFINPAVLSVKIEGAPEEAVMYAGSVELSATVATKGQIAKGVSWKSSDESVATVDENGAVTLVGEGSVTITATSESDASKSDSVTFSVVYKGLHPGLLNEGYSFSKEFPAAAAEFVGEEVYSFETLEGFYYKTEHYEGLYSSYDYVKVLVEYSEANIDAVLGIGETDYFYFEGSEADCFISASQNHEIDLYLDYLSEDSDDYAIFLDFYRCEDIWETSEPTTDTAWEEETAEALAASNVDLPFIALGAEYDVYVYSSGMIEISDYCADFHKLDNYGAILEEAGYVLDEELGCYVKDIDAYSYAMVAFGFDQYGNTIQVMVGLTELDAFPADEVHAFVSEFSENNVPSFDAEGVKYTYQKDSLEFAEDDERETVFVGLVDADGDSLASYFVALGEAGFDFLGDYAYENYMGYSLYDFIKGKLLVFVEIEFDSHAASEEEAYELYNEMLELYYAEELTPEEELRFDELYNGYFSYIMGGEWPVYDYSTPVGGYLYITSEPRMSEDPGIYLLDEELTLAEGEKFQLNPILYGIDKNYVYYFSSNDSTVATVDEETGLVTAVSAGTTQIYVFTSDYTYYDSITVTVPQTKTFADALAEANAILAASGDSREINLPEPEGFAYGQVGQLSSGTIRIIGSSTADEEAYCEKLAELGYEIGEDDLGYPIAVSDDFRIEPWTSGSYFIIDIIPLEPAVAEGAFFDFSVLSGTEGEDNGFSFVSAKGEGQSAPAYNENSGELRLYINNTITFSSEEEMTEIFFDANTCVADHDKANGTLSCDVGEVEAVEGGFLWTGSATEVTFTVDSGKQVHINSIRINGGKGGDTPVEPAEFPLEELNAAVAELGTTATIPAFSGTASAYEFDDEASYLYMNVGSGNEEAAIAQYQADLVAAGYTAIGTDTYGDMNYLSPNGELVAIVWQSSSAGYIALEWKLYVAPATSFPLEEVNTFLSENGFGFTLSQDVADALTALLGEGEGFSIEYGTYQGYPWMNVAINGSHSEGAVSALASVLEAAGYADEGDNYYYNSSSYMSVSFSEEGGFTSILFY